MKAVVIILLVAGLARAQENPGKIQNQNDPHFPATHKLNAGIITTYTGSTPPPVLIADVNYGISNRFSVGIIGGTTGTMALVGVKLNAVLYQQEKFRSIFRMVSVYYPERNGTFLFDNENRYVMPWMFTFGVVDGEWKSNNGTRWSIGMGLLETHCVEDMAMWFGHLGGHEHEGSLIEMFNTVQASASIPVSSRITIRPELIVVMRGLRVINLHEFKVNPVAPYLNIVYSFGKRRKD
ncbi:MAG: hypothetical protein SH819_10365 [Cytophagales bacterium]|nr:hypothetical protein [Cytophagales bacterium]